MLKTMNNVRALIELEDGQILEVIGPMVEFSVSNGIDSLANNNNGFFSYRPALPQTIELTIRGISAQWKQGEFIGRIKQERTATEWQCPYCSHINPRKARICGQEDNGAGCGHPRPFTYE